MAGDAGQESPSNSLPRHMNDAGKAITHGCRGIRSMATCREGYLLDDSSPDYTGNKTRLGTGTGPTAFVPFD